MIKKLFGSGLCTLLLSLAWFQALPQVICKDNVKIFLDEYGIAVIELGMFTDDTCMCDIVEVNSGSDTISCNSAGKNVVVRITQPNGFSTLCLGEVIDNIPPDFGNSPASIEVNCYLDLFESPPDSFGIEVSDSCGIDSVYALICGVEQGDCDDIYKTIKVQWQAIDLNGNVSSFMQMVSFLKEDLEDVDFPDNDTLFCDQLDTAYFGEPLIFDSIPVNKFCGLFAGSEDDTMFICQSSYMIFRTWTVLDLCDLSSTDSVQVITVLDTVPPQITCPVDDTIYVSADMCIGEYMLPDTLAGMVTNCPPGDTTTLFAFKLNGGFYDPGDVVMLDTGTYEVTLLLADDCWNMNTCSYSLEVIDTIELDTVPPLLSFCPPNDTLVLDSIMALDTATLCIELDGQFGTPQFDGVCCAVEQIFCELVNAIDMAEDTGRYERKWWAVDECGNTSDTCFQTIVILDTLDDMPMADLTMAFSRHETLEPDHPPDDKLSPFLRVLTKRKSETVFRFSPNPFSNQLNMNGEISEPGVYIFEVFAFDGRKVWQEKRYFDVGYQAFEWNARALGWPSGPLVVRWISPHQTGAKRILFYPDQ